MVSLVTAKVYCASRQNAKRYSFEVIKQYAFKTNVLLISLRAPGFGGCEGFGLTVGVRVVSVRPYGGHAIRKKRHESTNQIVRADEAIEVTT